MRVAGRMLAIAALASLACWPSLADAQKLSSTHLVADSSGARLALLPGDIVRLRIWREPDLSGEFPVDETGVVVFPKLGAIDVQNVSPEALKARLLAAYAAYLKDPAIEVTMLRRVNVLGAVVHPGVFPVDPTMTISDVLALAGGATPDGNRYRADLIRNGKRLPIELATTDRIADVAIRSGDQLFVPERSWASRNQGIIAATISASVSLLIVLFRR